MTAQPENPEPQAPARQGFSPLLVILTLVVVGFVLWFCPQAIRWAYRPADNPQASPVVPASLNANR